jgi:hypothetical protein
MVGSVGIEPTTKWLKATCSTTELRAREVGANSRGAFYISGGGALLLKVLALRLHPR